MHKVSFTIFHLLFIFFPILVPTMVPSVLYRSEKCVSSLNVFPTNACRICAAESFVKPSARGDPANVGVDDASTVSCNTERRPQRRPVRFIPFYGFLAFGTFMVSRALRSDLAGLCASSFAHKWMKNMRGSSLSM